MRPRPLIRASRRALLALAAGGVTLALVTGAGSAAPTKRILVSDDAEDVSGALDIRRATLSRAADGRLRAAVTFGQTITPSDLLAGSGPPGSVCLRVWTSPGADPGAIAPDRLVCVTARSREELRASVLAQGEGGSLQRTGSASVAARSRSIIVRFAQSALGRPERFRLTVEATRPGCARVSCVDTAPQAPSTRTFRLR